MGVLTRDLLCSKFILMKSILEYQNYRQYMRDFYGYKKQTSVFSWREFSKLAGFVSPNYLKQVCEKDANLSKAGVCKVANAMGLEGIEATFFEDLVIFDQAKSDEDKKKAFAEMNAIAHANRIKILGADSFKFYESWLHPVIRELAPAMPGAKPKQLAKKCHQDASADDVEQSLDFLVRAGLLQKTGPHAYRQVDKNLAGSAESMAVAICSMNRNMAKIAETAIDRFSVEERNFTGITMGVSDEAYAKVVDLLRECRNKIVEVVSSDKKMDRVYRLNLQLFPLTERVQEDSDENNV